MLLKSNQIKLNTFFKGNIRNWSCTKPLAEKTQTTCTVAVMPWYSKGLRSTYVYYISQILPGDGIIVSLPQTQSNMGIPMSHFSFPIVQYLLIFLISGLVHKLLRKVSVSSACEMFKSSPATCWLWLFAMSWQGGLWELMGLELPMLRATETQPYGPSNNEMKAAKRCRPGCWFSVGTVLHFTLQAVILFYVNISWSFKFQ